MKPAASQRAANGSTPAGASVNTPGAPMTQAWPAAAAEASAARTQTSTSSSISWPQRAPELKQRPPVCGKQPGAPL